MKSETLSGYKHKMSQVYWHWSEAEDHRCQGESNEGTRSKQATNNWLTWAAVKTGTKLKTQQFKSIKQEDSDRM